MRHHARRYGVHDVVSPPGWSRAGPSQIGTPPSAMTYPYEMTQIPIRVTLRRNADGATVTYETTDYIVHDPDLNPDNVWCPGLWEDGNYACDCNRALFWSRGHGHEDDQDRKCGEEAYTILDITRTDTMEHLYAEDIP